MNTTRSFRLLIALSIIILGLSSCQPRYGGSHKKRGCGCPAWNAPQPKP